MRTVSNNWAADRTPAWSAITACGLYTTRGADHLTRMTYAWYIIQSMYPARQLTVPLGVGETAFVAVATSGPEFSQNVIIVTPETRIKQHLTDIMTLHSQAIAPHCFTLFHRRSARTWYVIVCTALNISLPDWGVVYICLQSAPFITYRFSVHPRRRPVSQSVLGVCFSGRFVILSYYNLQFYFTGVLFRQIVDDDDGTHIDH